MYHSISLMVSVVCNGFLFWTKQPLILLKSSDRYGYIFIQVHGFFFFLFKKNASG